MRVGVCPHCGRFARFGVEYDGPKQGNGQPNLSGRVTKVIATYSTAFAVAKKALSQGLGQALAPTTGTVVSTAVTSQRGRVRRQTEAVENKAAL